MPNCFRVTYPLVASLSIVRRDQRGETLAQESGGVSARAFSWWCVSRDISSWLAFV